MRELIVDPEFKDKIPPLKDDEFKKLEENILADGEVREPIVVWNNIIIDGHNRWKIIQKHNLTNYKVKPMEFADKWAAIVWMCRNQTGRRNLNELQFYKLIQEEYDAMQKTKGGQIGNKNAVKNELVKSANSFSGKNPTRKHIADVHNMTQSSVKRAVEFGRGLDEADKLSPGIKNDVLSGEIKAPKKIIAEIRNMPDKEKKDTVERIKRGELIKEKPKNTGRDAKTREVYSTIQGIKNNLYDEKNEIVYTHIDLEREIILIVDNFTSQIKRAITIRSTVLSEEGAYEKISAVLSSAENKIEEIRRNML